MPRLAQVFSPRDRVYFELFEEAGGAIVIPQGGVSGAQFAEKIIELKKDPKRIHSLETKVRPFYRSDSAELIVKELSE